MANKDKQEKPAKAPKQEKSGKGDQPEKRAKGKADAAAPKSQHTGAELPVPPPRLKVYYEQTVRARLREQLRLANVHEIPKLEKIVVNCGVGEAVKQPKLLDSVVDELAAITGQRPVRTKAKKSISNFGLRKGQEIGASVTLRGARMWEFLDRLVNVAMPRIRDFRGINTRSFDGRGNYSLGLKEQMIFPEIDYDQVAQVHGLDITFVTTARRDDRAYALLRELGMPFRGEDKPLLVSA